MFGGTLGDWVTNPVDLELKPGYKPFNIRYYPVPIINKEAFRKELKLMVEIIVLTPVQHIKYSTPVFIIPKKEGTGRFIIDYRSINHKLVRNLYPLPRTGNNMQKLEVLQYVTALYLNMGCYNIRLYPDIQYMTMIVTEFGKFRYNRLHMGMCASGGIFQGRLDELLGDIEDVKTYINDILVFRKDCFENHIEQLRMISARLCAAGLKLMRLSAFLG